MKVLLIGGTGTISMAISKALLAQGEELWLLNRGNRNTGLDDAEMIFADINDEEQVAEAIAGMTFDVVADFIAFRPEQVERDYRLFAGKTKQYIFISSASAYQKPVSNYLITESTPLANPLWNYSRDKIACEEFLMGKYRTEGFPVTIVRPSHTYDERSVPLGAHGNGSWQVLKRMLDGKKVLIQGDGTSLWVLTHNRDFAKGFIGLMGNPHAIGDAVHITSDEVLTWNQIYQSIADALGVPLRAMHVPSDVLAQGTCFWLEGSLLGDKSNSVVFDNTKIKRLVPGYTATKRFDQGVKEAVEYVLAHPELQKEDPAFDEWCDKVVASMEEVMKAVKM